MQNFSVRMKSIKEKRKGGIRVPRTVVAMSGGVDSSATAALLLEQGHVCAGVHLKVYQGDETVPPRSKSCCSLSDAEDARAAAHRLGVPFYVFNMTALFAATVISPFVQGYLRGETPNPCIECNRSVKFGALLQKARTLEYDNIATGHYARREAQNGRFLLRKGLDHSKDQSYVLYMLTQDQLAHTLFPLGGFTKEQARALAVEAKLLNAHKRDSQDICFIPDGDCGAFLERTLGKPLSPGDFVTPDGTILGRHRGVARYTLGQRKGLGLALPAPGYVCGIDPARNTVTVGEEALLFRRDFIVRSLNFFPFDKLDGPLRCKAKVRYQQTEQWAVAEQTDKDELRVAFDVPQRAITPGQATVLYEGDYVIGGGTIVSS
jgi:tRNA-specific 2-thiouridylase